MEEGLGLESELMRETGVAANGDVRGNSTAEFVDTSGGRVSRGRALRFEDFASRLNGGSRTRVELVP